MTRCELPASVLLDLPGAVKRLTRKHHVFLVGPRNPQPEGTWEFLREAASRRGRDLDELYQEVKICDAELRTSVLP